MKRYGANRKYDVCGVGSPFVDILINAEDSHLEELKIRKGATHLLDNRRFKYLIEYFRKHNIKKHKSKVCSGGDCPNTLIGVANLGGKVVFIGNIGSDKHGKVIEEEMKREGVICNLNKKKGKTSTCIVLITPDSERSMNTFLGECLSNNFKINKRYIVNSKYLYTTGHMFDNKQQKDAAIKAMKIAKKNNVRVAFDLADPVCVENYRNEFYKVVKRYVNVLFANETEARLFTNQDNFSKALYIMSKLVDVAVIKLGRKGSVIKYGRKVIVIDPHKVKAVDTTGAGDSYASGFLFGLSKGYSLETSGNIASFISSRIVQQIGARLNNK